MLNIFLRAALVSACVSTLACTETAPGSGEPTPPISPPPEPSLCNGELDTERAALQRLTRPQYLNTLSDLVGVPAQLPVDVPGDDNPLGFYNGASAAGYAHASAYRFGAEWAASHLAAQTAGRLGAEPNCEDPRSALCITTLLRQSGLQIYRRPLTDAEALEYMDLFDALVEQNPGLGLVERFEAVLSTMLQAPDFLYRPELGLDDEGAAVSLLDHYGVANRLSYFLWNSMPDEELFAAAGAGALGTVEEVEAQATRMLQDARADQMLDTFIVQWLDLQTLEQTVKSALHFPAFTPSLREAAMEETVRFFREVFRSGEDATLGSLLTADFSVVNGELARFYGVEGVEGDDFVRASLPPERSGLLTQLSFLAVNAHPTQTSPVLRGRFVRERLFCQPIAPPDNPDDDVDLELPEYVPGQTMRERLSAHQDVAASCFGCHSLMDNIGFGFEGFDGSGAHRLVEEGEPVNTTGEIVGPESVSFDGPVELTEALSRDEAVRDCFARQWFYFAHRRAPSEKDTCSLEEARNRFASSGFNIQELLVAITGTDSFRYVRGASQGVEG